MMRRRNAYSSMGQSVEAYQPFFPPPVVPQDTVIRGSSPLVMQMDSVGEVWDQHSRLVNRDPRRIGIRTLFSYGGYALKQFRMIATGQVESSTFQPRGNHMWDGEFNDAIYQMGYPRNLALTFKVNTVNKGINAPWQQTPRPNFGGRTIYTSRRPVTSGIPGTPAVPAVTRRWS